MKQWIPGAVEISTLVDSYRHHRASVQDYAVERCLRPHSSSCWWVRIPAPDHADIAAGVSVPLALAGTCAGMWLAGFSDR